MCNDPSYTSFGIVHRRHKKNVRILLVQEYGNQVIRWKLAGGKSEQGERDPRQTLTRELQEKVSVTLNEACVGPQVLRLPLDTHTFNVYAVTIGRRHGPRMNPQKVDRMRWFYAQEIEYLIMHNRVVARHAKALRRFLLYHM